MTVKMCKATTTCWNAILFLQLRHTADAMRPEPRKQTHAMSSATSGCLRESTKASTRQNKRYRAGKQPSCTPKASIGAQPSIPPQQAFFAVQQRQTKDCTGSGKSSTADAVVEEAGAAVEEAPPPEERGLPLAHQVRQSHATRSIERELPHPASTVTKLETWSAGARLSKWCNHWLAE